MQIIGRRYDTRDAVEVDILDGRIERLRPYRDTDATHSLPWIAPGFVDIQVNGYNGQEFSSLELTPQKVAKIVEEHYAFGVTSFCPTLTTAAHEVLVHGMSAIHQACLSRPEIGRRVAGIHLEGPYFSPEDGPRGAHPKEHCRQPDWLQFQRLQEAAGGRICLLTMSVEFDESAEFINRVVASGVRVAIGHTAADSAHIKAAVDAGATLSTHLGNGAHRMLRRHPNYIWDQLAEDRLTASLIVDGHHLPPEVVKSFVRAKSPERIILVSDLSGLAGMPVGRYTTSGCELEILSDGRLVIAGQDQLLAGASLPIGDGVANIMRFAGVDLATAVHMATKHASAFLGQTPGGLRPGDAANLVLFDLPDAGTGESPARLTVRATVADGELVYAVRGAA